MTKKKIGLEAPITVLQLEVENLEGFLKFSYLLRNVSLDEKVDARKDLRQIKKGIKVLEGKNEERKRD